LNEADARAWLVETLNVSRETLEQLAAYAAMIAGEQVKQNLVSAKTLPDFWSRHIVDSAQLLLLTNGTPGAWLDIGSGAGLPGMVVALITGAPVTLVEPRPLRADFLQRAADALKLEAVTIVPTPLGRVKPSTFSIVTARAVAALPKLVAMAIPFTDLSTVWVLPKGRTAHAELESLPSTWQGDWIVHPSVTDSESYILIGIKGKR
jgi:16S rRNA (guanine527-N7)-methyltransferase